MNRVQETHGSWVANLLDDISCLVDSHFLSLIVHPGQCLDSSDELFPYVRDDLVSKCFSLG